MNPLAIELNNSLNETVVGRLLSNMGKRLYFPKGIIAQSAEAKKKGKKANATIGMACVCGKPMMLSAIHNALPNFTQAESVAYAPTAGNLDLRNLWLNNLAIKNPSLNIEKISVPVVIPGLTAGISFISDLFLDASDTLITALPAWDNYALIVEARCGATLAGFPFFEGDHFNINGFKETVNKQAKTGSVKILLNCPQNPTGYSLTTTEADAVITFLTEIAEKGTNVLICSDDAYFGLRYESNIYPESLFARLSQAHQNLLAVKIDGPTKEDYVWGFRTGFLTFGSKDMTTAQYDALVKKLMGAIRSSVSCCSTPAQTMLLKAYQDSRTASEKAEYEKILEKRYRIVKKVTDEHKNHSVLTPLPFNSGYFMSFHCTGVNAETLRTTLLETEEIGTIAIDAETLRIAFSSLETNIIEDVYRTVYKTAEALVAKH